MKRRIGALALALCFLCVLCSCSNKARTKERIAERIAEFETCVRNVDINGVLDCIDPQDVKEVRLLIMGLSIISAENPKNLTDVAEEGLFAILNNLVEESTQASEFDSKEAMVDCLSSLSIRADEISSPTRRTNDQALANCVVELTINGQTVKSRAEFKMIKSDGEWYIDWR